jgi:hypothetical protein
MSALSVRVRQCPFFSYFTIVDASPSGSCR